MARLSDQDIERLIAGLATAGDLRDAGQAVDAGASAALASAPASAPARAGELERRLRELSSDGSLGPLLTQRLAAYVRRPLRCSSGAAPLAAADGSWYVARCGDVDLWVHFDALLTSSLADAMIGGDGEAPKVGYGTKVARIAAGAAGQMLVALAAALGLPEPSASAVDSGAAHDRAPAAGGDMAVGSNPYPWSAGVVAASAISAPQAATMMTPPAAKTVGRGEPAVVAVALERSRIALEEMLDAPVAFVTASEVRAITAQMPPGALRVGSSLHGGGAIVLAVDRGSASALVNGCVGDDVAGEEHSELAEMCAEVIADVALGAFTSALDDSPDELQHVERLGDETMLAELPHRRFDVRFTCGALSGMLHWDVPEHLSQGGPLGTATRPVR